MQKSSRNISSTTRSSSVNSERDVQSSGSGGGGGGGVGAGSLSANVADCPIKLQHLPLHFIQMNETETT
ncbi:hypothetical protein TKK_0014268 [Trichogramma kaykai]